MLKSLWENVFRPANNGISADIQGNILFKDLSPKELKFVKDIVHVRNYKPGEEIFRQHDIGSGMYIVSEGGVDITVEEKSHDDSSDENELIITRLGPGDFFGEMALVQEEGLRSAAAKANRKTTLIGFFKPNLLEIIQRSPSAGVKILLRLSEVLGKRLTETTDMVSSLKEQLNNARKHS